MGTPVDMEETIETKSYDTEAVKNWLLEYRNMSRDIENQMERLNRIEMKMDSIGSPTLSDMPKSPSPAGDRIADMVAMKVDLESEISGQVARQKEMRGKIETLLRNLRSPDEKAVIRTRYLDGMGWSDVVDLLFGGNRDFLDKEESYLRRTHKIHGSALLNIARYIDIHPIPEIAEYGGKL